MGAGERQPEGSGNGRIAGDAMRHIVFLGVPTFGLAFAITTVSVYVPVVAHSFTSSSIVIGVIIGGEGLMAMWVPLVAGTWSDRLESRYGGRLPFMLAATPVVVAALLVVAFVNSLVALGVVIGVFFLGYFIAYEPYRALYPDVVEEEHAARAQSTQAIWRGAATGLSLVGGGLMLGVARVIPFLVAAGLVGVTVAGFAWWLIRRGNIPSRPEPEGPGGLRAGVEQLRRVVAEHRGLRAFLVANALWELSLGALKTFVVLYITRGLGHSLTTASLAIGLAALFILAAAIVSGKLGDRIGTGKVLAVTLWIYGVLLLIPFITTTEAVLIASLPFIALAGGVIMTLPYALLIPLMPEHEHGSLTGFYSLSRGIGTMLGPLLGGVAVQALSGPLSGTHGYQAMWLVCSVAMLASIPFLRWMRHARAEREAREKAAEKAPAS